MARKVWPWALALLLAAPLVAFPAIDITVSSWFYDPSVRFFPARIAPFPEWVRREMPVLLFGAVGAMALVWLAGEIRRRPILGVTRRVALYLLFSLALGPGLVVNVVFKDNWGRPRPSTIQEFNGPNTYVRPLVPSRQCDDNCSFVSGHGALGFWVVAPALLAPRRWRRAALGAALTFGIMVGAVRIMQGGHFLSDVVASAFITIGISVALYNRMIRPGKAASSKNNPQNPSDSP